MANNGTVEQVKTAIDEGNDTLAATIANRFHEYHSNRSVWVERMKEIRNYIFATDTTTTSNASLPWKNSTTLPKLCQIRDNLHANYMAALFPNDDWLKWESYSLEDSDKQKAAAIEAYMSNKIRLYNFQDIASKLLYDYIDYGNCLADVGYKTIYHVNIDGNREKSSEGPYAIRRSPFEVVFNLSATSIEESPQILRVVKTIGELEKEMLQSPNEAWRADAIKFIKEKRAQLNSDFTPEQLDIGAGVTIDGFGSYSEYITSGYVEILEFRGHIYDTDSDVFHENVIITVIDRAKVLRVTPMDNWLGKSTLVHGGWRYRPDNLYAMGPLENLVGMQYRIDHLENIKADLFDLIAHPPLKIRGMVEDFDWEPFAQIYLSSDEADVEVLKVDATALNADTQIARLEQQMDEFAGAPKQAIGARTPGEKTAFEVQTLEQNASKMFQEKVIAFEINVLEPLLNNMLELSVRSLSGEDLVGVMDSDNGVQDFIKITKQDISAKGKIRPVGARHFARRAQLVQNYQGMRQVFQQDPGVMNHISGIAEAKMFEDILGLDRFQLVRENVRVEESTESARLIQESQRQVEEESFTPANEMEAEAEEGLI